MFRYSQRSSRCFIFKNENELRSKIKSNQDPIVILDQDLKTKKQKVLKPLRFQDFYWSEWRDLNSRPLDPQLRFDALHQIFYSSKLRFPKTPKALIHLCFLHFYYTTPPPPIQPFSCNFRRKKRTKAHRFLRSVRFLCVKNLYNLMRFYGSSVGARGLKC